MPTGVSLECIRRGRATLKELAEKAGRDPRSLHIFAFGQPGQFTNRQESQALEKADISHAAIWLRRSMQDDAIAELEELADMLLPSCGAEQHAMRPAVASVVVSVRHQTRGTVLCKRATLARGFRNRSHGLLGRAQLGTDEGMLIEAARFIPLMWMHTLFMNFPIDIVFLGRDNVVIKIQTSLKPWRFSAIVFGARRAIELPNGAAIRTEKRSWRLYFDHKSLDANFMKPGREPPGLLEVSKNTLTFTSERPLTSARPRLSAFSRKSSLTRVRPTTSSASRDASAIRLNASPREDFLAL